MPVATTLFLPPAAATIGEPDPPLTAVPEHAVQLAWVRGHFDRSTLRTTDGEPVDVIRPGRLNRDSGPDIRGAVVRIGGIVWAGDIEVHRTSGDWERHRHHTDPAYDCVVLHVVLGADGATGAVARADGSRVPELVLLPHLTVSLSRLMRDAHTPADGPPCARATPLPSPPTGWLDALGADRLRRRAHALGEAYSALPDLDVLMARRVFRALGYEANADAMETLASRLDLARVRTLPDDGARVAHLLTAAGLNDAGLFSLDAAVARPMPREAWRRGGRPANAPATRIHQAARLLAPDRLLGRDGLARSRDLDDLPALVEWLRVPAARGRLGAARARDIVANAVLPVWLLDGEQREDAGAVERVTRFARAMSAPSDRVLRAYADAGVQSSSALAALGVHQLAASLCAEGRCARCAIGREIAPALA